MSGRQRISANFAPTGSGACGRLPKPVVICWNGPRAQSKAASNLLKEAGVPIYAALCDAVRAIEALRIFARVTPVRANAASEMSSIS